MTKSDRFTDNDVFDLLAIWGDADVQRKLDFSYHKTTVFHDIATKLNTSGNDRNFDGYSYDPAGT
jgi:hypothetical protein